MIDYDNQLTVPLNSIVLFYWLYWQIRIAINQFLNDRLSADETFIEILTGSPLGC